MVIQNDTWKLLQSINRLRIKQGPVMKSCGQIDHMKTEHKSTGRFGPLVCFYVEGNGHRRYPEYFKYHCLVSEPAPAALSIRQTPSGPPRCHSRQECPAGYTAQSFQSHAAGCRCGWWASFFFPKARPLSAENKSADTLCPAGLMVSALYLM